MESNSRERIKRAQRPLDHTAPERGNETASSLLNDGALNHLANTATEEVAHTEFAMQPRATTSPLPVFDFGKRRPGQDAAHRRSAAMAANQGLTSQTLRPGYIITRSSATSVPVRCALLLRQRICEDVVENEYDATVVKCLNRDRLCIAHVNFTAGCTNRERASVQRLQPQLVARLSLRSTPVRAKHPVRAVSPAAMSNSGVQ